MALNTVGNPKVGNIAGKTDWNNTTDAILENALFTATYANALAGLSDVNSYSSDPALDWTPDTNVKRVACVITFSAYKKKKK